PDRINHWKQGSNLDVETGGVKRSDCLGTVGVDDHRSCIATTLN
ncbi:hypothetical protein LINGRAHAP2_LOCUS28134, partial [Linum grandiflorum]